MSEIKKQYNLEYYDRFAIEDDEARRIWINTEIDDDIINTAVYTIYRYNRMDKDNGVAPDKRQPIIIYLNGPGGSVLSCFALIDAIKYSLTPVYTVNIGYCYSATFLIFLTGSKRYSMPDATFLMHDGSTGVFWDSSAKVRDRMTFEEEEQELRIRHHIMSNSNLSDDFYDEQYRKEWYFYPEVAKKHGMVEYIVGTDCDMDEIM